MFYSILVNIYIGMCSVNENCSVPVSQCISKKAVVEYSFKTC